MPKKLSTEEFIRRAQEVHKNLYNYEKTIYINITCKVCIIDPDFGEFWQNPGDHLAGKGNIKRGQIKNTFLKTSNIESFIERAKKVHGDLYDYKLVEYVQVNQKVCIIDPIYGEFWQKPGNHLKGQGNPIRSGRIKTTNDFILKAKTIHGETYDYSK